MDGRSQRRDGKKLLFRERETGNILYRQGT